MIELILSIGAILLLIVLVAIFGTLKTIAYNLGTIALLLRPRMKP